MPRTCRGRHRVDAARSARGPVDVPRSSDSAQGLWSYGLFPKTAVREGADAWQSDRWCEHGEETLMPSWLLWTLAGLGIWCAVSVPVALLVASLFRRPRTE